MSRARAVRRAAGLVPGLGTHWGGTGAPACCQPPTFLGLCGPGSLLHLLARRQWELGSPQPVGRVDSTMAQGHQQDKSTGVGRRGVG